MKKYSLIDHPEISAYTYAELPQLIEWVGETPDGHFCVKFIGRDGILYSSQHFGVRDDVPDGFWMCCHPYCGGGIKNKNYLRRELPQSMTDSSCDIACEDVSTNPARNLRLVSPVPALRCAR